MAHLIDKDALVAEIDKHLSYYKDLKDRGILSKEGEAAYRVVRILKSDINFLEVKEVDLEKIINNYFKDWKFDEELDIMVKPNNYSTTFDDIKEVAKHFFEFGVSCQVNNINMDEVKTAAKAWSEDDENTRGCDYIGAVVAERAFVACAEWLINKAQKGE